MGAFQAQVRRAVPSQPVEIEAALRAARSADLQANRGDGIAFEVGDLPFQFRRLSGGEICAGALEARQVVFAVVMLDVKGDIHSAGIAFSRNDASANGLARVQPGARHQAVTALLEMRVDFSGGHEGRGFDPADAPGRQAGVIQGQQALAAIAEFGRLNVADGDHIAGFDRVLVHETLHGAGQVEVIKGAVFGRDRRLPAQRASRIDQADALGDGVGDRIAAIGRGNIHAVGDGPAIIGPGSQTGQPVLDAHQAADIARVAIGIPAAGIDDHERALEVVIAVEHGENHQTVVGHHVAIAAINVIAIAFGQQFAALAPIRFFGMPLADVVYHGVDDRIIGDD